MKARAWDARAMFGMLQRVRMPRAKQLAIKTGKALVRASSTFVGFAFAIVMIVVPLGSAAVWFGVFDVGVAAPTPPASRLLFDVALERAVLREAQSIQAPPLDAIARLARGAALYHTSCEACHRAPGAQRAAIAEALSPRPADLSLTGRRWTPAQVFWIAKHGIRLSGMPAWGGIYNDESLWDIAALAARLPTMPAGQYADLVKAGRPEAPPKPD